MLFLRRVAALALMLWLLTSCVGSASDEARQALPDVAPRETADAATVQSSPDANVNVDVDGYLLPDPARWVVIRDWSPLLDDREQEIQLDFALLDEHGIPDLSRPISVSYFDGALDEMDRRLGDSASVGEVDVVAITGGGTARIVVNEEASYAAAIAWMRGRFVQFQTQNPLVDLDGLVRSLRLVDEAAWVEARATAQDNVELAVAAAMVDQTPLPRAGGPLPHFVLPDPWQLVQVTDKTIWTDEERAQEVALAAAMRPDGRPAPPSSMTTWHIGVGDTKEEAAQEFVPSVSITVTRHEEDQVLGDGEGDPPLEAFGLVGTLEPLDYAARARFVEGDQAIWVWGPALQTEQIVELASNTSFRDRARFDGLTIDHERFAILATTTMELRPPSWHAWWEHPDGVDASMSVWSMDVNELRVWLFNRDHRRSVPEDIWETIAAKGLIDFGHGMTYDVEQGLLFQLSGIAPFDLVAISIEEWTELATPLNTDPLRPR